MSAAPETGYGSPQDSVGAAAPETGYGAPEDSVGAAAPQPEYGQPTYKQPAYQGGQDAVGAALGKITISWALNIFCAYLKFFSPWIWSPKDQCYRYGSNRSRKHLGKFNEASD